MSRTMLRGPQKLRTALLLTVAVLCVPAARGQLAHKGPVAAIALSQTLASYDVSTIKENKSGEQSWGMGLHGDVFTATNAPLETIIGFAYDIKDNLISGLTGPVTSVNFDVMAKVLPGQDGTQPKLTGEQLQAMIIPLLAERFHLKVHLEPKIMPVYDLVVARSGFKLKLDTSERTSGGWDINGQDTEKVLTGKSDSMADLADALSDLAGRKVIDKTGLAGHAEITLKWSDDVAAEQGGSNGIPSSPRWRSSSA
jgi:bla regulator protein blaR1